ncbi:Arc family DNA-binding protein [Xenorhabdus sp. PB62.4]|uniref:Arc family DNA-binding protein n=1 Tax=Xenorhabdus sp. PB62.4 TaxID=1851573 RepID=UPI001656D183|nr:Arc family DNA-binding protein [Xenorhabdus sp. PB62.4]MBC8954886.1 DNA-binding protein [Xenorhabdus sp. PB62.4]
MSREDPQLRVRIPAELKETLEQKASENKRTLTAEIVNRLEETTNQDALVGSSNGFERIAVEYEDLCSDYEALTAKFEREYAIDWADSNKDELRSVIEKLHKLLSRPEKK